jgi:hypothetical protein
MIAKVCKLPMGDDEDAPDDAADEDDDEAVEAAVEDAVDAADAAALDTLDAALDATETDVEATVAVAVTRADTAAETAVVTAVVTTDTAAIVDASTVGLNRLSFCAGTSIGAGGSTMATPPSITTSLAFDEHTALEIVTQSLANSVHSVQDWQPPLSAFPVSDHVFPSTQLAAVLL